MRQLGEKDVNDATGKEKGWILVTGGSRGIGRGLVETFARAGYDVVFTFRSGADAAREVERATRDIGRPARGVRCDCGDEAEMASFARAMLERRGAPYGIVHNAGVTRDALLMQMTDAQWHDVINTNLNGAFYVTRSFIQPMSERGEGVVLLMSSVAGHKGVVGQANYSATKAALGAMARTLALEAGRFQIRVNAIAPGYIATDMVEEMSEMQRKAIKGRIPLRRIGEVGDVAALALFLVSDAASYITGQTLVVDGGLTA